MTKGYLGKRQILAIALSTFLLAAPTPANAYIYPEYRLSPAGSTTVRNFTVQWGAEGRQLTNNSYGTTVVTLTYSYPSIPTCYSNPFRNDFEIELLGPTGQLVAYTVIESPTVSSGTEIQLSFPTLSLDPPLAAHWIKVTSTGSCHNGLRPVAWEANSQSSILFAAPEIPSVSGLKPIKKNPCCGNSFVITWDAFYSITEWDTDGATIYFYRWSQKNKTQVFGPWLTTDLPLAYKKLSKKSKYAIQVYIETPYGYSEISTLNFKT